MFMICSQPAMSTISHIEEHQVMRGSKQCPSCGHKLQRKPDWLGLPAGVKFDPTDQELIEHLEAKVSTQSSLRSHPLIDEFIPTIEGEDGICYTHPEKLPGVTRDGLSKHFFHRPSKAYTTGTRKRRKIQTEVDVERGETRWHKTGKTRPVTANGKQKGCKKILVLYTNFGKHRKPEKTNWVMHQYHLGELEEEKEGELVVSKIFYQTQPRQCSWSSERSTGAAGTGNKDSGSCSSTKEVVSSAAAAVVAEMAAYGGMEQLQQHQQQRMNQTDGFNFSPFRKSFDEVGMGEAAHSTETSIERDQSREELDHCHRGGQPHDQTAAVAFQITRPTNSISAIISQSTPPLLQHHNSMHNILDDTYHVSRILLQDKFEQQQQRKLVERSAGAGLEDLIMGCTSSSSDIKEETSSIPHPPQETEWLKYSYWSPDRHDHHG